MLTQDKPHLLRGDKLATIRTQLVSEKEIYKFGPPNQTQFLAHNQPISKLSTSWARNALD